MKPTFAFAGFAIPTHELFVFLGALAGAIVFAVETRRRGSSDERLLWIIAGTLMFGALGAKLATVWRYVAVSGDSSFEGMILRGGRSILGGLAGAYVGAHLTKRLVGYPRKTGDLFAPAVALGMAIGRVGCFLSEQVGTPTTMPWGLRLSDATLARIPNCSYCVPGVALHPSFLYEIAFHAAAFAVIWFWLRHKQVAAGEILTLYIAAYGLFRFFVEFVRGNDIAWMGLTRPQLFLIVTIPLLLGRIAWKAGQGSLLRNERIAARGQDA